MKTNNPTNSEEDVTVNERQNNPLSRSALAILEEGTRLVQKGDIADGLMYVARRLPTFIPISPESLIEYGAGEGAVDALLGMMESVYCETAARELEVEHEGTKSDEDWEYDYTVFTQGFKYQAYRTQERYCDDEDFPYESDTELIISVKYDGEWYDVLGCTEHEYDHRYDLDEELLRLRDMALNYIDDRMDLLAKERNEIFNIEC